MEGKLHVANDERKHSCSSAIVCHSVSQHLGSQAARFKQDHTAHQQTQKKIFIYIDECLNLLTI